MVRFARLRLLAPGHQRHAWCRASLAVGLLITDLPTSQWSKRKDRGPNPDEQGEKSRRPGDALVSTPAGRRRVSIRRHCECDSRGLLGRREIRTPGLRKMADAFGDELFSVFEDDSATAAGAKKDKDKEKEKWKGPPAPTDKAG